MLPIVQAANHEEVEEVQERDLLEVKWGGRDDRVRGEGAKLPYDVLGPLLPHENRMDTAKEGIRESTLGMKNYFLKSRINHGY